MKFLLLAIFSLVMFSCSQTGDVTTENESLVTLKAETENKRHNYEWVDELEGKKLSENITDFTKNIHTNNSFSLESVLASYKDEPLMPVLHGFGSLDTSSIPSDVKGVLIGFCDAVIKKAGLEKCMDFFSDETFFVLAFFLDDIAEKKIASYLIGSPYVSENNFEVPVRFFSDGNFFDCAIFFDLGDDIKINQIKFLTQKFEE